MCLTFLGDCDDKDFEARKKRKRHYFMEDDEDNNKDLKRSRQCEETDGLNNNCNSKQISTIKDVSSDVTLGKQGQQIKKTTTTTQLSQINKTHCPHLYIIIS